MKKFFIVLIFVFFLTNSVFSADVYYTLKVDSTSQEPSTAYAGDTITLSVNLKNQSLGTTAKDVSAVLLLSDYFTAIDTEEFFDKINGKETKTAVFQFKVNPDAHAGTHNLSLKLNYIGLGNKEVSTIENVSVTISNTYKLDITDINVSNYSPHIGEDVEFAVTVENTGSFEARDVTVSFSKTDSTTFGNFLVLSEVEKQLGNLQVNESKQVFFKVRPTEKIDPGIYTFTIDANCLDCPKTATEKATISVLGKPDLIFSGIDFSIEGRDDKKLMQGDAFSFSIQLDNIGKEEAKAVEVEITTPNEITGSKTSYVGSIEEDDSGAALFELVVSPTAKVGEKNINIKVTYINEVGEEESIVKSYTLYVNKAPEPSILIPLILIIIILVIAYFLIKMVFRQLALRKT